MIAPIPPRSVRRRPARLVDGAVLLALVFGATALTLFVNAALVAETLGGRFVDPDDAMRLVEVRDWLAGQSWFDMRAMRLDPPTGSFMHWSRLVDLPAAAWIKLFALATDPIRAEGLAAVAVPGSWLVALYFGMARLATLLVGPIGRPPALLGTLFSGATLVQFGPGRIGHHAPETVVLVFAVGAAIAALDLKRAREAFACGGFVALSLAMSLETLPFDIALCGGLVGVWVWRGADMAMMLRWFGAGLLVALPVFFLLTVGPDRWSAPVCDAYGAAHLGAGLVGGAGALTLAILTPHLRGMTWRLAAALVPAGLVVAYVAFAYPACLHSPFAGVDPLVRDLWLSHVVESRPLLVVGRTHPMIALAITCPVGLGCVGSIAAMMTLRGTAALRFTLIAIVSLVGLALAFWQVRVLGSVTPIALCGGIYLVGALGDRLAARGLRIAAAAPLAILAFSSTAWALVLPDDDPTPENGKAACLAPAALTPLAALPPGSAVAPMDSGAYLLEATRLSVLAAPYHRNNDGNRFAFEVFLAAPETARGLLASRDVTYVLTCPGMGEMDRLAARAPGGLAAKLAASAVPDFLKPVPVAGTPYRVYAVTRAGR